jgi:hypothetical protein
VVDVGGESKSGLRNSSEKLGPSSSAAFGVNVPFGCRMRLQEKRFTDEFRYFGRAGLKHQEQQKPRKLHSTENMSLPIRISRP